MFSKNLKYYRLKNNMSVKELASSIGVTPMTISYYENGERKPGMETIKVLAGVLNVRVTDFLNGRNQNLVFSHGEFRKGSRLSVKQQDYIRESIEEYLSRFYCVIDMLGGEILPEAPVCHGIKLAGDIEENAFAMRRYLHISEFGPVGNLIGILENKGILVYVADIDNDAFSGMNGTVNGRPFIVVNGKMNPERIRSTIAHEMVHILFEWPKDMEEKQMEEMAAAISGAFLFPEENAKRKLGIRRTSVTRDIEEPTLFMQLVFRAVGENEISVQKGAELLKKPYSFVMEQCLAEYTLL